MARRRETPLKYIGVNVGVEDHSNDPELTASAERGETLLRLISERIAGRAEALLAEVRG